MEVLASARTAADPKPFRRARVPELRAIAEARPDGTLILRSALPARDVEQQCFADFLPLWADRRAATPALCERAADRSWRRISWAELWTQVQAVAAGLLDLGLGQDRPLMLLSGNSIEQAVLLLAAEYVGIPAAPVSPAYSLRSSDHVRLKGVRDLLPPAAVFVQSAPAFARAFAALDLPQAQLIAVEGAGQGQVAWQQLLATELTPARRTAIAAAHAAIRPEQLARVLFTSGSTGVPKGVATTYATLRALVRFIGEIFGQLTEPQPVFLDWLPWHHAFGLLINLNRSMLTGATHYIDDGKPLPGEFERTVQSLREVSPSVFNTVPTAWAMLATELERDPALARSFFAKAVGLGYGGASLPRDVWERVQRVAERTVGERIQFHTGLGSTETAGSGCFNHAVGDDLGNVGVPTPGTEVKLIPQPGGDGRYELRVRLAFPFGGYLQRPDLSAAALDEEGFFIIGDAVRLNDPADPTRGVRFAGRVVEDFKLANGTWVRTGAIRLGLVELCTPLLGDAVICGHDQEIIGALAWPNVAECRRLAPELAQLDAEALVRHPRLIEALNERLRAQTGSVSLSVARLLLMAEPPSMDANEIADKGYINQAATRARRAHLVDELFQPETPAHIVRR
ncbi:MAG TPA: AMP-binding protein [Rubrivivax sp.]|nr:AMP-binding protein [Rubrivivax sp.]